MKKTFWALTILTFIFTSCETDNWIDWKLQNELWLEQNIANHEGDPNFHVTESGLQYEVLYQGNITDTKPDDMSYVYCNYEGKLINDYVFDSGTEVAMSVAGVVKGFAEGLKRMNKHADYILYIPWDLGYGDGKDDTSLIGTEGGTSYIPPYSTLIFTIHLVDVIK